MSDDELVSMYKEQMELHRDRAEVYRQKLQAAEKKLEKISAAMCSEEIDRVLFFLSLRYLSDTEKVISSSRCVLG